MSAGQWESFVGLFLNDRNINEVFKELKATQSSVLFQASLSGYPFRNNDCESMLLLCKWNIRKQTSIECVCR